MPFSILRDATSPTVTLTVPERLTTTQILVQWSADESGSGIRGYDLDVSGDGGASWTHLLTETQNTSYTFTGTLGVAYTFRVRATDNVSNVSTWAQAEARTVVVKKYYSVADQRVAMRANGVLYYLHSDHLGSTSLTTSETGAVVAEQRYLPYGEVRWVSGTLMTDLTYTGQRQDEIGLLDYHARWYSDRLGRFVSADTMIPGVGGLSLNRYTYASGNPIRYNDPTGYFTPGEIDQYLRNTYADWESYRDAWMADIFFWNLLSDATYGDALFAPGSGLGVGLFTENGDTFGFECYTCRGPSVNGAEKKNLADYQSQAMLDLVGPNNNLKYSIGLKTIEMGSVENVMAKWLLETEGLDAPRRPIYDYSGGYPAPTGKSWVQTFGQDLSFGLLAGDVVPWVIGGPIGSKFLERVAWASGAVPIVSIVTFVNEAIRFTWRFDWAQSNTPYNDNWQYSWGIKQPPPTPSPVRCPSPFD